MLKHLSNAAVEFVLCFSVDGDVFLCICLLEFHFIVATSSSSYLLARVVFKLADRAVVMHGITGRWRLYMMCSPAIHR